MNRGGFGTGTKAQQATSPGLKAGRWFAQTGASCGKASQFCSVHGRVFFSINTAFVLFTTPRARYEIHLGRQRESRLQMNQRRRMKNSPL